MRQKSFRVDFTFIANATVVVSSFAVLLQVVRHVCSSQELATNFAGDFVLMACKMRPKAISCSKRGVTNLEYRNQNKYSFTYNSLKPIIRFVF